ncbi:MAG: M20/M25/M40 family metallo-hydrolase [Sphingosinicella sp.]
MFKRLLLIAGLLAFAVPATARPLPPHHAQARAIFERLVTFRSAQGHGQVPAMANYIAETLRAGGVPAGDIVMLPHGETTGMIVRIPGRDRSARPILFSGHMDVVDARPEDWERSPFQLGEENGYFFGRGTSDNKSGITAMVSTILRLQAARARPRRTLLFAFVGDEETTFDTTRLIAAHEWVRGAEYAINTDGGGGTLASDHRPLIYLVQTAEKTYATFRVTARNPGGHSSRPRLDNAIYDLARALLRIEQHRFPVMANAMTRAYLDAIGRTMDDATGATLRASAANPHDPAAADALFAMPEFVGTTRTTCIATMLEAGHAENALPQRASATVNCRIFPGVPVETMRAALAGLAGEGLAVEPLGEVDIGPASDLRPDVTAAITRSIRRRYPGVPIVPHMISGATDGIIYRNAGIPTFGTSGLFSRPEDEFAHGLNERIAVASFYAGIEHVHDLARELGGR